MNFLEQHYDEIFKPYTNEELIKDVISFRDGGAD